jgi:hypothetical protein
VGFCLSDIFCFCKSTPYFVFGDVFVLHHMFSYFLTIIRCVLAFLAF